MANMYVTKDQSSLYLTGMIENGDQLQHNWSLSKSYTLIIAKGSASITDSSSSVHSRDAIGLYRVAPNENLNLTSTGDAGPCIVICPFLLSDDTTMNELFTDATTLASLRNSSSYLIDTTDLVVTKRTDVLTTVSGNLIFSLTDLDSAVLGGLSI
jgi:hypothetical protein